MTPISAVIRPLRFVVPEKPMWVHHSDRTRSPVVRVIMYGRHQVGIIWKLQADFNAWWRLDGKPMRISQLHAGSTSNGSLRGAMNAATRSIRNEIEGVIALLRD